MRVTKTTPPPQPPTTYTMEGLSEEQAIFLRDLLGRCCDDQVGNIATEMYNALHHQTDARGKKYVFRKGVFDSGREGISIEAEFHA